MGTKELKQYRAAVARERSSPHRYVPTQADEDAQAKLRHQQNQEHIATHSGITHVNEEISFEELKRLVETSAEFRIMFAEELMNTAIEMSDNPLRDAFVKCAKAFRS